MRTLPLTFVGVERLFPINPLLKKRSYSEKGSKRKDNNNIPSIVIRRRGYEVSPCLSH